MTGCADKDSYADLPDSGSRPGKKPASNQKYESSIFGRDINYDDSFTPADNIALPIDNSKIIDMLQIGKSLYFLADDGVYTLNLESGESGRLFETDAPMFALYGDSITAALSKLPQDVFEAAALDGASGLKMHLKITLPLISPSLFFVMVLSFVNFLKIFKESYLYYNTNYPPDTAYMIQNYMNNHFYKLNYQNLSTAVTLFTIAVAIIIFLIYKLVNRVSE